MLQHKSYRFPTEEKAEEYYHSTQGRPDVTAYKVREVENEGHRYWVVDVTEGWSLD